MTPDRNGQSSTSDNEHSRDSGYISLVPSRRSRTPSPPSVMNKAAQILDEKKWRESYRRHNESGVATAVTAKVIIISFQSHKSMTY